MNEKSRFNTQGTNVETVRKAPGKVLYLGLFFGSQ